MFSAYMVVQNNVETLSFSISIFLDCLCYIFQPRDWFVQNNVETRITDYSLPSISAAIQDCDILVSLLHDNSPFFVTAHQAMITACQQSPGARNSFPVNAVEI